MRGPWRHERTGEETHSARQSSGACRSSSRPTTLSPRRFIDQTEETSLQTSSQKDSMDAELLPLPTETAATAETAAAARGTLPGKKATARRGRDAQRGRWRVTGTAESSLCPALPLALAPVQSRLSRFRWRASVLIAHCQDRPALSGPGLESGIRRVLPPRVVCHSRRNISAH